MENEGHRRFTQLEIKEFVSLLSKGHFSRFISQTAATIKSAKFSEVSFQFAHCENLSGRCLTIQKNLLFIFMKDYYIQEKVLEHFSSLIPLDVDYPEFEIHNSFELENCETVLSFLVKDNQHRESLIKYIEANYKNPQPQTRTKTALSVKIILEYLDGGEPEGEIIETLYEILIELLKDENHVVLYFSWKELNRVLMADSEYFKPIALLLFERYFHGGPSILLETYRCEFEYMNNSFSASLWSRIFRELLGYLQKLRSASMVSFSSFIDLFYCLQRVLIEENLSAKIESQIHRLQNFFLQELESGLVSNFLQQHRIVICVTRILCRLLRTRGTFTKFVLFFVCCGE
jgi:hypothetical protein